MKPISPLVLTLAMLGAVLSGCGDDDSSGGGNTGGSAGSSGDAGTGGSGSAGSGSVPGLTTVACYRAGSKDCKIKGFSSAEGAEASKADCTSNGDSVVDHCPSEGLQGCCLSGQVGNCYYDAAQASNVKGPCGTTGASAWSATAP